MDPPDSKKSRLLECGLRSDLLSEEIVNGVKSAWKSSSSEFSKNGVEVVLNPFPVCVVENFINNPELLKMTVGELKDVTFHQKSNDLYEFKQSDDLRNLINFTFIPQLYDLIRVEGRKWINKILGGNKLNEEISATFSSYGYQDRLLCHDDKCEDRHIAFILYLVENWNEDDGGSLDLFNTDANGYPEDVIKRISPQFNTIVFFEVTHHSFHQVSEVKSKTKRRLSLNGWFHSTGKRLDKASCVVLENQQNLANEKDFNLEEYFLFTYFDSMNKMDVKNIFSSESEIQLDEFIVPRFLEEVEADLGSEAVKWVTKGPANIRKYEIADPSTLPASLRTLKEIFESTCWFRYLKTITGLDFSPSVTSDMKIWEAGTLPVCNFEIQRWTHTCYTLIHDQDPEFHSEALDVILRIPFDNGEDEEKDAPEPGHIIYIDSESKDEECVSCAADWFEDGSCVIWHESHFFQLLHIGYKMNSLGLIFRDEKTLRFTKYLDSTAKPFYQILCTYRSWKPPSDRPELNHCKDDESEDSFSEESGDDCS